MSLKTDTDLTPTERVALIIDLHRRAEAAWDEAEALAKAFPSPRSDFSFPYAAVLELGVPYKLFPPEEGDPWWLCVELSSERFASVELPPEGVIATPEELLAASPGRPSPEEHAAWVEWLLDFGYLVRDGDALRAMAVATKTCSDECSRIRQEKAVEEAPEGSRFDVPHIGDCPLVGHHPEVIWAKVGADGRTIPWPDEREAA